MKLRPQRPSVTGRAGVISMNSPKFGEVLILIGLIGLMMSCSAVEQIDHDDPVRPLPRVIDTAVVNRLKHTNSPYWNHAAREIQQITDE